jgi:hypothetical protein
MHEKNLLYILAAIFSGLFISLGAKAQSTTAPEAATQAATQALNDSRILVQSAQYEIQLSKTNGSTQTACSIYLTDVLNFAGFSVGQFVSNDFDKAMRAHLPSWQMAQFTTDNPGADQARLRLFLNSAPDGTAFLAQWTRNGESGHVALIEKAANDQYLIYQAQRGLSLPYVKPARIQNLLYPKGAWGDRSHLNLFFE